MNDKAIRRPLANRILFLPISALLQAGFFTVATLAAVSGSQAAAPRPAAANQARIDESFGQLPLSFEANRGQTDSQAQFLAYGPGYSLFLTPTGAVLALRKPENKPVSSDFKPGDAKRMTPPKPATAAVLRMQLIGGNAKAEVSGLEALPGQVNYIQGKDAKNWRTGIATYGKVKYTGVYPGVDLIYYGKQRQLEYDFVVAPGADPNAIRMNFEGAEKLTLDAEGRLMVKTAGGEVIQHKPIIYQEIDGLRRQIAGGYRLYPANEGRNSKDKLPQVSFQVARYDSSRPLVIDPVMAYAIYLGGSSYDGGSDIAVDNSGNVYVAGYTGSTDFPILNAYQDTNGDINGYGDVFVTKFNANGTVVYSTYLGGSSSDYGSDIAVDNSGNAYVAGSTSSTDFPTVHAIKAACDGVDVFITKFNTNGVVVFSTCLGGSGGDGGHSIALDGLGNAYVTGATDSIDFPMVRPIQAVLNGTTDIFVTKLNSAGSAIVYSTYLGGSDYDNGVSIAVDGKGSAYVTGSTLSADFPTVQPLQGALIGTQDAFVAKLNPTGSALVYSTYLGGSDNIEFGVFVDRGNSIAVDRWGNAYVTGMTSSTDFPTAHAFQGNLNGLNDAFVAKLNLAGSSLVYATFLGGSHEDYGYFGDEGADIAVDRIGNAYVSGSSSSASDFPTVRPFQVSLGGFYNGFVTKFRSNGTVVYSTFIGGVFETVGTGGGNIAVDGLGNAYVTGGTGASYPSNVFPTSRLLQVGPGGGGDAFVTKIVGN